MKILVLNSGSSSQKACLYEIGETLPNHPSACLWEGRIDPRSTFGDGQRVSARASAYSCRTGGHGNYRERSRRDSADSRFRHRLSSPNSTGGGDLSRPLQLVRERHSPLRIPRHQSSILRWTCRSTARDRSKVAQGSHLPPG